MATKATKVTEKTAKSSFKQEGSNGKIGSNGTIKDSPQNGRISKTEHAAQGGKALLKAWKRIAERNGEGY